MMERHATFFTAALGIASLCLESSASAQSSSALPVGNITANPTIVANGAKPTLTWYITNQSTIRNLVTISSPALIVPTQNLVCDIRILGAGVTSTYPNGAIQYYETRCQMRSNGSTTWTTVFDGKGSDPIVQSQGIINTSGFSVQKNQPIKFAAQFRANNAWSQLRTTESGDYAKALVNGDACPSGVPAFSSPSLKSFLKPYVDASNKVKIGSMDVILFMELTHTNPADLGYDRQDLVLLITFRTP